MTVAVKKHKKREAFCDVKRAVSLVRSFVILKIDTFVGDLVERNKGKENFLFLLNYDIFLKLQTSFFICKTIFV